MKHPDTSCDCAQAATPLALRWRCPWLWQDRNHEGVDPRCRL
jgi:hypothetical protein